MSVSAQRVFDLAMGLMDEVNESTGSTDTSDTKEYKQRTLLILNVLRGDLYPYSDTFVKRENGKRPVSAAIENFTDGIDLDDVLCESILPYGLAAHLLLQENPDAANFFQQKYDELKILLGNKTAADFEPIEDIYGGFRY
jgi:hypothetical protein